jgi:hypothetical protein
MKTTKKNIKVKKDNNDISITIENNLNANNKQINHQPIKRRRRKKKVEDTDEESLNEQLQLLPKLRDTSYIKPGPVGNFQIWRDNMDSYNTTITMNQAQQLGLVPPRVPPALPAPPLALPAPPTPAPPAPTPATPDFGAPTYEAFAKVLSGFDVKVLAYDKYKQGYTNHYVSESSYDEMFEKAELMPVSSVRLGCSLALKTLQLL